MSTSYPQPLIHPPQSFEDRQRLHALGIYLTEDVHLHGDATIESPAELPGGLTTGFHGTDFGAFSYSWSKITPAVRAVGRYCSIASDVGFGLAEHPTDWLTSSSLVYDEDWMWGRFARKQGKTHVTGPISNDPLPRITIGHDVWIGYRCYIKAGVTIGHGAVIGAHAVVTRDVPPYAIVVGNPGRIARYRFAPDIIVRLLAVEWWNYAFTDLPVARANDVPGVLDEIEDLIRDNRIQPYRPQPFCLRAR